MSYSFRQQDLGFAIAITVIENKHVYPLRVEALPITRERVTEIVKTTNPLFAGTLLPVTKLVLDHAAVAVEQDLAIAHPGLRVRTTVVNTGGDQFIIQFQPAEGLPVIADATFDGSVAVSVDDLHVAMVEAGIGQVFSEAGVQDLLDRVARPMFEKLGYMRVRFSNITSKPAANVKGLDVHATVTDGPRFKLGAVTVRGAMAGDARRIIRMANLPQMDFMNFDAFTGSAPHIKEILRSEGYLDASVTANRAIDDASLTVDAWFDVNPGEVYTFGKLDVIGLGLDGEAAIRKLWSVKPGDPFPGGYPDHFAQTVKTEGYFDNLGSAGATPAVNRRTHVVDVTLLFTTAPRSASGRVQ